MKSTPTLRLSFKRLSLLTLVLLIAVAALLGVAASANKANRAAKARQAQATASTSTILKTSSAARSRSVRQQGPNAPTAVSVTASMVDAFPVHPSGKANPGDTVTYTATITSTGTNDATGLVFNDTVDPFTTFVPGSEVASAVALNDTYPQTLVGNVSVDSSIIAFSATANDFLGQNPSATISSFTAASANGGTVTMTTSGANIGQFTYDPPAGYEGIDTFTYTLTDQAGNSTPAPSRTGTVSFTISGMVWFINNNGGACASSCDGRLSHPFTTLAAFQAVNDGVGNHPADADNIFIYESGTSYVGPVTLRSNQKLIGQDATASLSTITGLTPPSSSPAFPAMNSGNGTITKITSAGNAINLTSAGTTNLIRGLTVGNTTGIGINGTTFGTLTVADADISDGAGRTGQALSLTTGTLAATFASILSTNSAATGITLSGVGGSLTTPTTSITNPAGIGISVGTSGATLNFGNTTSTTSGGTGVSLLTNTGTITFGSLNISPDANQRGLLATDNTQTLTATSGTITTSGAIAVEITRASSTTPLAVSLTKVSGSGASSGIVLTRTSGNFTVAGSGGTCSSVATCTGGAIQNTANAVLLNTASNVSIDRMLIQTTTDSGVNGVAVTNFTFTNGKIDAAGNATFDSAISFNGNGTGLGNNIAGTLTITGNTITNSFYSGVDVQADNGTVTNANISNNTITTTNQGLGINFNGANNASTAFNLQNATINQNNLSGIGGTGIQAQCSSSNVAGPASSCGTPGDGTKLISITNNSVLLQPAATQGITITATGGNSGARAKGNFLVQCNGRNTGGCTAPTATALGSSSQGTVILIGNNGFADMTAIINNNSVVATHTPNLGGGNGIAGGNGVAGAGNAWTPQLTLTVTNNVVSGTDGNGILLVGRGTSGFANMKITGNNVGTPVNAGGTSREGIRIDAGNAASADDGVCVTISSNTCAVGSNGAGGIGIRKQGVVQTTNDFGITGLAPSPATGPQAAAYVVTQNPAGNGCDNISGSNFQSCATAPPIAPPADDVAMNMSDHSNMDTAQAETAAASGLEMKNGLFVVPATLSKIDWKQLRAGAHGSVTAKSVTPIEITGIRTPSNDGRLSHHAVARRYSNSAGQQPLGPLSGEAIPQVTVGTLPAGKTVSIQFQVTVDVPPKTRLASTQGTVSGSNFANVLTDDPAAGGGTDPTTTPIDTTITWTGAVDTNWNTPGNWTVPGPVVSTYAPGITNPAINDVIIPTVATQPTIPAAGDRSVFSLSVANGMTLTITGSTILTIGAPAPGVGGDLAFTGNGTITGGFLNFGTGSHFITNTGTGSLSATNVATVISGSSVVLSNNLQAGALAINAGGSMDISSRTLSLNGSGAALAVPGGATFTTALSTVVFNGTAAQTAAGITYNNLTINNTIGAHVTGVTLTGSATVNGVLTLTSSDLATGGANTLTMPLAATSGPASGATDVVGNVKRTGFVSGGSTLSFGNPFNTIRINSGTAPTDINILLAKNAPTTYATAVLRSYTITPNGGSSINATVRLHYRQAELNGNSETPTANFNFRRFTGGAWKAVVPTSRITGVVEDNWLENNTVTTFSEWTFANLAPTATGGIVTGRIVDDHGNPVEGAVVRLGGTQNRKFITDANGFYRFENVETNGFYTVTPSRANYSFNPSVRSFSQIGEATEAAFGATLSSSGFVNPLDTPEYFVRQHYLDFLGREPDEAGFNFWSDQILGCGYDEACVSRKRENVSAAYFLSIEFQQTGGLVDGLYRAAYGARPDFARFMPDTRTVGQGVVVNGDDWEAKLKANKEAFANAFVNRPAFHAMYDSMDSSVFVETLISHTGVSFTSGERDALVSGLSTGTMTRADALRSIAENNRFVSAKLNETFVMMEYFGYLRRDADAGGFAFWLNKLNQFGGNFEQAEMVKAFIVSGEYRDRFPR